MSSDEPRFYVLSIRWSEERECATWWGPDGSGYSMFLENAGVYTQAEVEKHSLNDGVRTMAIPVKTARDLARSAVHNNEWDSLLAARLAGKTPPTEEHDE